MKAEVYNLEGKKVKQIDLPVQFNEPIRPDIIKKAFIALQLSSRTPYGAFKEAGKRYSSYVSKRRRKYKGIYGRGASRVPRKVLTRRGTQFYYVAATTPFSVGGRRAHPPKSEKNWYKKINTNERRKAIRSALAATFNLDLINSHGYKINIPSIIIDSKIETKSKTNDIKKILLSLGLGKELERTEEKQIRAGRGKSRGRKYKTKSGILLVVSKECSLIKSASNLPGLDISKINELNVSLLAPGSVPGRFTIYTEDSIKELEKNKLFLNKK
ncbi:50S ribosomal protein L4 [Candidatus Woesearchaeota archaeon]|nr:50S ribosomal protein L4 [Candidatus Woesearchaeota archaeon]